MEREKQEREGKDKREEKEQEDKMEKERKVNQILTFKTPSTAIFPSCPSKIVYG